MLLVRAVPLSAQYLNPQEPQKRPRY